jgi:hypothetical protein
MGSSIALKNGGSTGSITFSGTSDVTVDINSLGAMQSQLTTILSGSISGYAGAGGSSVYGLIYNKSQDTYMRFGTGTAEDYVWISTVYPRLNDNSNSDAVTTYFNQSKTVQGNMKRVVVDDQGNYVKDYTATNYAHPDQTSLTATQSVMVKIPKFYYLNIEFTFNGDVYNLFGQSLSAFTLDLASMGFASATSISGQNVSGYQSYSTIVGTNVTAIVHPAFNHNDGTTKDTMYIGAFESYEFVAGKMKSTCTTTGTSTAVKATASQAITAFRTKHAAFGSKFQTQNWFQREALVLTVLIERGTFMTETNGTNNASKWEGYSWNTSAGGDDQNIGQTLKFLNSTGVIKDSSNRTIANTYRGVENYHSHLWEFVDGINVISGACWVAKTGSTYVSDVTTGHYFNSGRTTLTSGAGAYISNIFPGTFIPSATTGSSTTKMTDAGWFAAGNMVLLVGGHLASPGPSGVSTWASDASSSNAYWYIGGRFAALV